MNLPAGYSFHTMTSVEVATLAQWAADEQWNPGRHDIAIAHSVDPDAFIALRHEGEMVGGGSIFSYDGRFGFMGLFIVRPDYRSKGLGTELWHHRLRLMRSRLDPGAAVGMDGVFAMAPFYAKGGFVLAYRDLRFDGVALDGERGTLQPVSSVGFAAIDAYDRRHVAAPRTELLRRWLAQEGAHVGLELEGGEVVGLAVMRSCRTGYRFGPVHADRPDIAERLLRGLMAEVPGAPIQIDVPEPNVPGLALAASFGMTESFGCARMYHGPDPGLPVDRIYGVTSFEFG